MLRIYNTMTRRKEEFVPLVEGKVGMYFCGMTLQEAPHLGHIRASLTADIFHRYFKYLGYDVVLVQNFTDIDDKVIEKAREENEDWRAVADFYEKEFLRAVEGMNFLPPTYYPRATQHIQEIIDLVERLVKKGYAYESGGDVYFRVSAFKEYGKLSGKNIEDLRAGARVEVDQKKHNPLDFALWKSAKPGEPWWYSPWGKGRPGWHIECSAMSMHYLGETFDIHGGGSDLIFPHHENEIAQSESATGKPFVRYWVHNEMVRLAGDKMSKSLKHFVPISELLERYPGDVLRLYLLMTHYRSPLDYDEARLEETKSAYGRFIELFNNVAGVKPGNVDPLPDIEERFTSAMDDDFNTPSAIGVLFDGVKQLNVLIAEGKLPSAASGVQKIMGLGNVLGLFEIQGESAHEDVVDSLVELLLDIREQMRQRKEWEMADKIRDGLVERGIVVKDTPDGPKWHFK